MGGIISVILVIAIVVLLSLVLLPKEIKAKISAKATEVKQDLRIGVAVNKLNVSDSTEAVLKKLSNPILNLLLILFPDSLITAKEEAKLVNEDLEIYNENGEQRFSLGWELTGEGAGFDQKWTKKFIPAVSIELGEGVAIRRIRQDTFDGVVSTPDMIIAKVTKSASLYPLEDKIAFFSDRKEATTFIKDIKLQSFEDGGCSPNSYNDWGDKTTDESVSRFFFHALGATLLENQTGPSTKPELGPIEINFNFMTEYAVREGFRPYGATVYFDADQKVTAIYDAYKKVLVKPGEAAWEETKFLAKSSGLALCNIRKHLLEGHLTAANGLSCASIKNLPPNHPIRRLLNVFTFNTNRVNDNAMAILITQKGLLHRFTAFAKMNQVFESGFASNNVFEPFSKRSLRPELLQQSKCGKLPYHKEGCEYYEIVEKFVREWLKKSGDSAIDEFAKGFYNDIRDMSLGTQYEVPEFEFEDDMVQVLSQGIFAVTAGHEICGNLIDYTNDPWAMGGRVVDGATSADVQGFTIALLVTAATGGTVPMLMTGYDNYFGEDGAPMWEKKHWADFIKDLGAQSRCIHKKENGIIKREPEFKLFDPERFESSVSV